jgi:hypothetical protein
MTGITDPSENTKFNPVFEMEKALGKPSGLCSCGSKKLPMFGDKKGWYCISCKPW